MTDTKALYACAEKDLDGTLRIIHGWDDASKLKHQYRIPAAPSKEEIRNFMRRYNQSGFLLIDVSELVRDNVISQNAILRVDLPNQHPLIK